MWLIEIRNFLDEFILKHRSLTTCPWKKSWLKRAFPFGSSLLNFRGVSLIQLAGSFLHPLKLRLWSKPGGTSPDRFTKWLGSRIWVCIIFITANHPPPQKKKGGSIKPHDFSPQQFVLRKKRPKPNCNDSFLEKAYVIQRETLCGLSPNLGTSKRGDSFTLWG